MQAAYGSAAADDGDMTSTATPLPSTMSAWTVHSPGPIATGPLRLVERQVPRPGPGEVLVEVGACGVCRTDLHVAEGDLPTHRAGVVPGHEVVGRVVGRGSATSRFELGDRIGIAWLRGTCGGCGWCRRGRENLCEASTYTGWDSDGGYAEYAVPESFAYRIPAQFSDEDAAPLLCAGIIGYRSLRRANLPPAGSLAIYGFGGSAHLTAQVAIAQGAQVHVVTRGESARALAAELGAASVGHTHDRPPVLVDSAIVFAPAGDLVPLALQALAPGGTVAIAGIHLSDVPVLNYQRHLFRERTVTSVTSNTRRDGEEFLLLAARLGLRPTTRVRPLTQAADALAELAAGDVRGATVLRP
jgi:propanol-preferring alcohol dehydrogenase